MASKRKTSFFDDDQSDKTSCTEDDMEDDLSDVDSQEDPLVERFDALLAKLDELLSLLNLNTSTLKSSIKE